MEQKEYPEAMWIYYLIKVILQLNGERIIL